MLLHLVVSHNQWLQALQVDPFFGLSAEEQVVSDYQARPEI